MRPISHWTRLQMRSQHWSETLSALHIEGFNKIGGFICDPILFQGLCSPTMSFPTTLRNGGSSPNCKDNIPWLWFSAVEVSAPRTGGSMKGSFDSILSSRLVIAG